MAHEPSRQGISGKRWACAKFESKDRTFDFIGATLTETLPIGRIEKLRDTLAIDIDSDARYLNIPDMGTHV